MTKGRCIICIIVYKPIDVKPPTKRVLKRCWRNNDDGAGYAVWDAKTELWNVKKGFMSFRKFWKSYRTEEITVEDVVFLHFRIGTSGEDTPELTHPFPVVDDLKKMGELNYSAADIVLHNGIIGQGEKEWSDTCVAVRDIVDPLHPYLDDDKVFSYLSDPLETQRNKWIITKGSQIFQYGKWELENGIEYSNATYKEDRWAAYTTHGTVTGNPDTGVFGFPTYEQHSNFRKVDGHFDWDKWEARGSKQTELPWSGATTDIPPNEDEEDPAIVIDIDAEGKAHPEPAYNANKASELLCCPNCYHDKYLDNSPYNVGDTICLICGCVFVELTGETCTFDPDIHRKWTSKLQEVSSG